MTSGIDLASVGAKALLGRAARIVGFPAMPAERFRWRMADVPDVAPGTRLLSVVRG